MECKATPAVGLAAVGRNQLRRALQELKPGLVAGGDRLEIHLRTSDRLPSQIQNGADDDVSCRRQLRPPGGTSSGMPEDR